MARVIRLDHITKIYGHANLHVRLKGKEIEEVKFEITEGARFFEAIIRGRAYNEVPPITSRICGTCGPSHVVGALKAIENAFGIDASTSEPMRKLMIMGSIIQNHVLHLYFLALPDYVGETSIIKVAKKNRKLVERGMRLHALGNEIVFAVGGREVHPISPIIDGFSHLPSREKLSELRRKIGEMFEDALETVELFAGFSYPEFERESLYLALDEYDYTEGNIIASDLEIKGGFENYLNEYLKPYSTAKFVTCKGKEYTVGPLARINLNLEKISDVAKRAMRKNGIKFPSNSIFDANKARALEIVHAMARAEELINEIETFEVRAEQECLVRDGKGLSVTEAPRGLLFHEYEIKKGRVTSANIITPTAQNLASIEKDVKVILPGLLGRPNKEIVRNLEMLIRAYDPCISCSTHFLKVKFHRAH